jgi:TolB-like protein/DNA-binding winged helix-turn-helix (wHTH) protein/tetratricopeptide (TPR) repeat protein
LQLAHQPAFTVGSLDVRPATCEVVRGDDREVLQPRVMQVLVCLAHANGEVISRDDLIADCWDGRIVGEGAITLVLVKLRKLAAQTGAFTIETIPRVGYRLVTERTTETPTAPSAAFERPRRGLDRRIALGLGAAGLAAAAGAGAWLWRGPLSATRRDGPLTVAVLPFTQAGGGDGDLATGLTREVRNNLSRVGGLRVIADSSAAAVAAEKLAGQAAATRLKAEWLVDGSVTLRGDALRISLALLDAEHGEEVWTRTVDGRLDDLFAAQDRISSAVVEEMAGRVTHPGPARPTPRPRDPRAFRAVLDAETALARTRLLRVEAGSVPSEAADAADLAARRAQDALAIDPNEVRALLVLATLARNGWSAAAAPPDASPTARNALAADYVGRALLADPNDAAALAALGDLRRRNWRWDEAESLLGRAIAADPSLVEARFAYGSLLATLGRGLEALVQSRELVRLDPLDGWRRNFLLARVRYLVGDRAGALAGFAALLERGSTSLFVARELQLIHLAERDVAGLERLADTLRAAPDAATAPLAAMLGRVEAAAEALHGQPQRLLALVDADLAAYDAGGAALMASQQGRTSADLLFLFAVEYAWAGAEERALDLLDRALAARAVWPASLPFGVLPFPVEVRGSPRYAAFWSRDARLSELASRRLASLRKRQMAGVLPDGRRVAPRVSDAAD